MRSQRFMGRASSAAGGIWTTGSGTLAGEMAVQSLLYERNRLTLEHCNNVRRRLHLHRLSLFPASSFKLYLFFPKAPHASRVSLQTVLYTQMSLNIFFFIVLLFGFPFCEMNATVDINVMQMKQKQLRIPRCVPR